jgi:DNA-binding MarR family transcriptional regulator
VIATKSAKAALDPDVKAALVAYIDALTLAEPVQARLWQQAEITLTQLVVLRELRPGPQTAGRLGEKVGLSPTSVTRLVDRLERRGLVSRRRDSGDRRQVEILLEPEGERMLSEIRVLRGSDIHRAIESMSRGDRSLLVAALGKLVAAARAVAATEERP